jgi:Cu2+-exporting ATPase
MRVEKTGSDTTLGTIDRLSERARYARPAFVQLADRIASHIVVAILIIALAVASFWLFVAPERAFVITLSVLVVTCPCALALATPAAFAAAGSRLADLRLLLTNGNAIEALSKASCVVFDKTGTLTRGMPVVTMTSVIDPSFDEASCLHIAGALEADSTHPIACAFAHGDETIVASAHRIATGEGVAGTIDDRRWRLGRLSFAAPGTPAPKVGSRTAIQVFLGVDLMQSTYLGCSENLASTSRWQAATTKTLSGALQPHWVSTITAPAARPRTSSNLSTQCRKTER